MSKKRPPIHVRAVTPADYDEFCITVPIDDRLPNSGDRLCGLYDIKPEKFGLSDLMVTQISNYGEQTQVYNGVDATISARFAQGGQVSGGLSVGRTVLNNCVTVDSPQGERPDFCENVPPWSSGTQVKFTVVYPLPWEFQTSVIYQNFAGIENGPTYTATNAEVAPSLGRNLGACRGAAVCNATVSIGDPVPPGTMFEDRLQQLDVRLTKSVRAGGMRIRGNLDIHNIFNASNVLNLQRQYGATYLDVLQIMGGRLIKVGAQLDF